MQFVPFLILDAIFWGILIFSMNRDRSRYRNILFLFIAITFTIPVLIILFHAAFGQKAGDLLSLILMGLISLAVLAMPVMLMINGLTMIRKEGKSLPNLLSLFLGIAMLAAELAVLLIVLIPNITWMNSLMFFKSLPNVLLFFILTVLYGSFCFITFSVYSMFLQIIPGKKDFDYVIIHGAGLLHGDQVSKLLADRLDKAIEIYQRDPTPPMLIPSGGRGGDETVTEAAAMAGYLKEHGIPMAKIIMEDRSATTMENLTNSQKLIDLDMTGHKKDQAYIALVTSNYHVYRALRCCRKIGLNCTGIGSRVAPYYWPSATIREFAAVHREKKHLIIFLVGWGIALTPFFMTLAE